MKGVLGLDLSLTSTGVAGNHGGGWATSIRPKKLTGLRRIQFVRDTIAESYLAEVSLVVVEAPSFGSSGGSAHERAGLWWMIAELLSNRGIDAVAMSPRSRAQYATGNGDADKQRVLESICRFYPWFSPAKRPGIGDEADAVALCAAGADWLGVPMASVPAWYRKALDGVAWPAGLRTRKPEDAPAPLF